MPYLSGYVASKHAVNGMTKSAAIEYAKQGIRINAVCPGGVKTAMTAALDQPTDPNVPDPHPIGHSAEPEELASRLGVAQVSDTGAIEAAIAQVIARAMEGNVCRCGTYARIVLAVRHAAEALKGGDR